MWEIMSPDVPTTTTKKQGTERLNEINIPLGKNFVFTFTKWYPNMKFHMVLITN